MKISWTLFSYLARLFFVNLVFLLLVFMAIIYLFDTLELLRRASKFTDVSLFLVMQMGALKLPEVSQVLIPFAVLFSAMFTFFQLTKRSELVVVRSAGFSIWQFLLPVISVAIACGFFQMMVINPLGAVFLNHFERMERQYISRSKNEIAMFEDGLWLKQAHGEDGYVIIHAPKVLPKDFSLVRPFGLFFDGDDTFVQRIDAAGGTLKPGAWVFDQAVLQGGGSDQQAGEHYTLPTDLTIVDVEESFSSPKTMSFWRLPSHIRTLENSGFSALRLKVHFHSLLSQPLFFAAMVLLAATVSMRPPRFQGGVVLIGLGVFSGFTIFFFSSFLQALGASGQIPVFLASWSPAFVTALLGLSLLLRLEDG